MVGLEFSTLGWGSWLEFSPDYGWPRVLNVGVGFVVGVLARLLLASSSRRYGGVRGWSSGQAVAGLEFSTLGWGLWLEFSPGYGWPQVLDVGGGVRVSVLARRWLASSSRRVGVGLTLLPGGLRVLA